MAVARYWVGGSGDWTDTAHWSATSGGAGGASVPTSVDFANFTNLSGSGTVTLSGDVSVAGLTFSSCPSTTITGAYKITSINTYFVGTSVVSFTGTSVTSGSFEMESGCTVSLGTGTFTVSSSWVGNASISAMSSVVSIQAQTGSATMTTNNGNYNTVRVFGTVQLSCGTSEFNLLEHFSSSTSKETVVTLVSDVSAKQYSFNKGGLASSLRSDSFLSQRTLNFPSGSTPGVSSFGNVNLYYINITETPTYVYNGGNLGGNTGFVFLNNSGAIALF